VHSHHERWDGNGYPRGLAGEEIPLYGRIIGVVDAFEAMTSDRPYRKAMDASNARDLLTKEAGMQFDPAIVQTFLELLDADAIHIETIHRKRTWTEIPVEFSPEFHTGKSVFQTHH
jgi:HD-GYP domain-containing protein (c-di-GMP phosphodiesterase class II)